MQHDSPVPLDAVAAPDNDLGADGAKALRPALEKLPNLTHLGLSGTCGDVPVAVGCNVYVCVTGGGDQ